MATLASQGGTARDTRFFMIMALAMAGVIIAGFSFHLLMGRSSFAEPLTVHLHGIMFMGWVGLYAAQAITIASGNAALHRKLGQLAYVFVPAMMIAGTAASGLAPAADAGGDEHSDRAGPWPYHPCPAADSLCLADLDLSHLDFPADRHVG